MRETDAPWGWVRHDASTVGSLTPTPRSSVRSTLGIAWRHDGPGGAMSMLWYADTTNPDGDQAEREAPGSGCWFTTRTSSTLHIRDWLGDHLAGLRVVG